MENKTIGKRIRTLRMFKNMKRAELAELLGVSPSTITAYEKDEVLPPVRTLSAMADIFSVSMNFILFGVRDPGAELDKSDDEEKDN